MKKKLLINATNLHVGGGVQVAVSVIYELSQMSDLPKGLDIVVSDEVHIGLKGLDCELNKFSYYANFNTYGLRSLWSDFCVKLSDYDVVFTIFGPFYRFNSRAVNIVGFAQPWIVRPINEIYQTYSISQKIKSRFKYFLQSLFFKHADRLIVELEHVAKAVTDIGVAKLGCVDVVHNCLSSLYFYPEKWLPLDQEFLATRFSIGFVGRDYLHKNTNMLPFVKSSLLKKHGVDVDFYVTFNEQEWSEKSEAFKSSIINVGSLTVAQCPTFYQKMDAVIFPSLLECFSATPLEAMVMEKPLFASDRDFIRDVCGEFAYYFDPMNPESAANLISLYIKNCMGKDRSLLVNAKNHAAGFSSAAKRASDYIEIMNKASNEKI